MRPGKNKTGNAPSGRTRSSQNLKPPPAKVPFEIVLTIDGFTFLPTIDYPISFERYRNQEQIIYSIDRYVHGIFDGRGSGWTANLTDFVNSGARSSKIKEWQFLADQSYGASTLVNAKLPDQASKTLDQCLGGIKMAASHQDPSLMMKFWRICLEMRGIDGRGRRFNAVERLFSGLEETFSETFGSESALSILIKSLRQVSSEDFKNTVRIGFEKTLRTMVLLTGDENAMILHMWSHYFKYWDVQFLSRPTFLLKFDLVWHKIHDKHRLGSEPAIAISYYYTYAVYYLGDSRELGEEMIRQLFIQTTRYLQSQQALRWTLPTLAFAFSAKIQATIERQYGRLDFCRAALNFAIETLMVGDRECRTRAMMLGQILARWERRWDLPNNAEWQLARVSLIRDGIE